MSGPIPFSSSSNMPASSSGEASTSTPHHQYEYVGKDKNGNDLNFTVEIPENVEQEYGNTAYELDTFLRRIVSDCLGHLKNQTSAENILVRVSPENDENTIVYHIVHGSQGEEHKIDRKTHDLTKAIKAFAEKKIEPLFRSYDYESIITPKNPKKKASIKINISTLTEASARKYEIDLELLTRRAVNRTIEMSKNNINKSSEITIEIDFQAIDVLHQSFSYRVKVDGTERVEKLPLSIEEKNNDAVLTQIVEKQIKIKKQTNVKSILKRFSRPSKEKAGFFGRMNVILHTFFMKVIQTFETLENLWEAITHQSAKKFDWDMRLLSSISGTVFGEEIPLKNSLKYMLKNLQKERKETTNQDLQKRLSRAIAVIDDISTIQNSYFWENKSLKLIEKIKRWARDLDTNEKLLIPVGFLEGKGCNQMLLEVTKNESDDYTIALISSSDSMLQLFDHEFNMESGSQSLRREIERVKLSELMARIPTFIELQTDPKFTNSSLPEIQRRSKEIFLSLLHFDNSIVLMGKPGESILRNQSRGHFNTMLSYVKGEYGDAQEAKRFELAARLNFFLDVFKTNKKAFKNRMFWETIRTTAYQLAHTIEENKELLGDTSTLQGKELMRIYQEVEKILETLEHNPPSVTDLSTQRLPLLTGKMIASSEPPLPRLTQTELSLQGSVQVDPPMTLFDKDKAVETVINWGQRAANLMKTNDWAAAAQEARAMTRMIPADFQWNNVSDSDFPQLINAFTLISEAIARGAFVKTEGRNEDLLCTALLSGYAFAAAIKKDPNNRNLYAALTNALAGFAELQKGRLLAYDELVIRQMREFLENYKGTRALPNTPLADEFVKLSQFTVMASGIQGSITVDLLRNLPTFDFTRSGNLIILDVDSGGRARESSFNPSAESRPIYKNVWNRSLDEPFTANLSLIAPQYAETVSNEITNRYVTEFCPLGCSGDDCENYNKAVKSTHRFYPLYMLHTYVDEYCPTLRSQKVLHRDEITDLLYTQQTNQNAKDLFFEKHGKTHGFQFAHGFNAEDRRMQVINTFNVFLKHPKFFKHADLRWHFETKIFNAEGFDQLLKPSEFREIKPFIISTFKRINNEIALASAVGDVETAAYLVYVMEELLSKISREITISNEDRLQLKNLLTFKSNEWFHKWSRDLMGREDKVGVDRQKVLYSLLLNNYYKNLCHPDQITRLKDPDHIEMIILAIGKLEFIQKQGHKIDPEVKNRYEALRTAIAPNIIDLVRSDAGTGFVNRLLLILNPTIAQMNLDWELKELPVFSAVDKDDNVYECDIYTGVVYTGSRVAGELPEKVQEDELLQKLFGEGVRGAWNVKHTSGPVDGKRIVSYTNRNYPNQRIVLKYEVDPTGKVTNVVPEIFVEKKIIQLKGKKEWFNYVAFEAQKQLLAGLPITAKDLPPQVAAAIRDCHCYVDRRKRYIYAIDPESNTPYAVMKLQIDPVNNTTNILEVQLLAEKSSLLFASWDVLDNFTNIEKPNFIQVLGKNGKPERVHYLRFELSSSGAPLEYIITAEGPLSVSFPGYILADKGERPGKTGGGQSALPLPDLFDNYQLLRKNGEEKVLIPLQPYVQHRSVTGEYLPRTSTVVSDKFTKNLLYEYSIDRETNRLSAKSGDAYAYLAYTCMAHRDYSTALFYLNKARVSGGYNSNYDKIFEAIDRWKDTSDNGAVMKLHFALFKERILRDKEMQKIRAGKVSEAIGIDAGRVTRLAAIAEFYDKYVKNLHSRQIGQKGSDPYLDLTTDQESSVIRCVKELIDNFGDRMPHVDIPHRIRAQEVQSLPITMQQDVELFAGISKGSIDLWAAAEKGQAVPELTLGSGLWIIKNFHHVFDQLLTLDTDSEEFRALSHNVRLVKSGLQNVTTEENATINAAQFYLMRLITIRLQNSNKVQDLNASLVLSDGKLPGMEGSLFSFQKKSQIQRATILFEIFFKKEFTVSSEKAKIAAQTMLAWVDGVTEAVGRTDIDDGVIKEAQKLERTAMTKWQTKRMANHILAFVTKFQEKETNLKSHGANVKEDFSKVFERFILKELFGSDGAKSLIKLNQILKDLKNVRVPTPIQTLETPKLRIVEPTMPYSAMYGYLLTRDRNTVSLDEITKLEVDIESAPEAFPEPFIDTNPNDFIPILQQNTINDLKSHFTESNLPAPVIDEAIFDQLEASPIGTLQRAGREHRADMKAYLSTVNTKGYTATKGAAEQVLEKIDAEFKQNERDKEEIKDRLLQFVDQFNETLGAVKMRRLLGKESKLTVEHLLGLWRRGEITADWDENPLKNYASKRIPQNELDQLDSLMIDYTILKTKSDHLSRIKSTTQQYIQTCGQKAESRGDRNLAKTLVEMIEAKRSYSLDLQKCPDLRDVLYMEHCLSIATRPQQLQIYREMLADPCAVRQLPMGGGKSKVLLPLLAHRKTTGKNLVLLMLPDSLYETNAKDLDNTNRELFGQEMFRFEFGRNSSRSEQSLLQTYRELLKVVKNRGYAVTTKGSMLSFRNSFADLLTKLHKAQELGHHAQTEILFRELKVMSKINKLFYEHTDVIADEVDACLDVRKEVNFSVGENSAVDRIKTEVGCDIMDLILESKAGSLLHELKEALDKNKQATITLEHRQEFLKEIIRIYYDKNSQLLSDNGLERDAFIDYINNSPSNDVVKERLTALKDSDSDLYKKISALKSFMDRGFSTTFGSVCNVNYGRDPVSGTKTIPYKGGDDPAIGSEFDDDIEKIAFTLQDYAQNGVSINQVYSVIADMHQRAVSELRSQGMSKGLNVNDTQAGKDFDAFIKKIDPTGQKLGEYVSLSLISTPARIKALTVAINNDAVSRAAFCRNYIINGIKEYNQQIHSTSTDVPDMVHNFGGFSGTPYNLHTYHDKIHAEKNAGVDGRTWALLLQNDHIRNTPIVSFDFDSKNPIQSLNQGTGFTANFQAMIDTGAYLKGVSSKQYIDACLEESQNRGLHVEAGIYFNDAGLLVKQMEKGGKAFAIETAPTTDLMNTRTLYPQKFTVGADVLQARKAKAIVTIGEKTYLRDLFQAVWRLRQLHEDQRVVFAVSSEIKTLILNGEDRDLEMLDILKFCLKNEAIKEAEDNFRSEKSKIHGTLKRELMAELFNLIDKGCSIEAVAAIAEVQNELFTRIKKVDESFERDIRVKTKKNPGDMIELSKKYEIERCATVIEFFKEKGFDSAVRRFEAIKAKLEKRPLPPADWMPNLVDESAVESGEVEVEAHTELTLDLNLRIETLDETETEEVVEHQIPMVRTGHGSTGDVFAVTTDEIAYTIQNLQLFNDAELKKLRLEGWLKEFKSEEEREHLRRIWSDPKSKIPAWSHQLRRLSDSINIFDNEFYCSQGFERNLFTSNDGTQIKPNAVFYSTRKPITQMLIAKNKENKFCMIVPTTHEAHGNCRTFINVDAQDICEAVQVGITNGAPNIIYKSGENRDDTIPFEGDDLKQFYKFYVQAKIFNGEIHFHTEEEREALRSWILHTGVTKFRSYFEFNILAAKAKRTIDAYPDSTLYKLLNELEQSQSVGSSSSS